MPLAWLELRQIVRNWQSRSVEFYQLVMRHRESRRVTHPTSNGEKDFQMSMLTLEKVELLEAAIEVGPAIVPGVALPVNVFVCPFVGQVHFARLQAYNQRV